MNFLVIALIVNSWLLPIEGKPLEKISLNGKWFVESQSGRTVLFRGNEMEG
jgi:hypothetical protein